jgi:hypothetical protein
VYAPPDSLWKDPIYEDVVTAVWRAKDWEPVMIDWAVLAEELEDDKAELLQS